MKALLANKLKTLLIYLSLIFSIVSIFLISSISNGIITMYSSMLKSDGDIIKAFKAQLSSGVLTCHAEMLSRTPNQIIFQTSQFSKPYNFYKNWELWVFSNILGVWTLNRFRI